MVEQLSGGSEARDASGVTRGQNVLYVLPETATAIASVLEPAMARLDPTASGVQLLVLTPGDDGAVAAAGQAQRRSPTISVLPVTAPRRAARLLGAGAAVVVAGAPGRILDLIRSAALKLDTVRSVVIAWADGIIAAGEAEALESVMAEVPRSAPRIVAAAAISPAVEAIVERYARRPRRSDDATENAGEPVHLRSLVVGEHSRLAALGTLLDDLDPARAALYARSEPVAGGLEEFVRARGLAGPGAAVVSRGEPVAGADLVVLAELPPSRAALHSLAAGGPVVALVTPRELPALRQLAGGTVTPYAAPGAALAARAREERLRAELRAELARHEWSRELLALEPLLDDHDGAVVAAAALRLLERERSRRTEEPAAPQAADVEPNGASRLLFVNAGARDGVSARDLVGALANEAGVPVARIGRIRVQEGHSTVELDASVLEQAAARLTGVTLRGRQILARADRGAARDARAGDRRPARERSRGEGAPPRRRSDRAEHPPRPPRPPRSPRPRRGRPERDAGE